MSEYGDVNHTYSDELQDYRRAMMKSQAIVPNDVGIEQIYSYPQGFFDNRKALKPETTSDEQFHDRGPQIKDHSSDGWGKQDHVQLLSYIFSNRKVENRRKKYIALYIEGKHSNFRNLSRERNDRDLFRDNHQSNIFQSHHPRISEAKFLIPPEPRCVLNVLHSMDAKLQEVFGSTLVKGTKHSDHILDVLSYCQNYFENELHVFDPQNILEAFVPFVNIGFSNLGDKSPSPSVNELGTSFAQFRPRSVKKISRPSFLTMQDLVQPSQKLMTHQLHGIRWLLSLYINGLNGVLADDMGLGKSIQTAVFLNIIRIVYNIKGNHLIICPTSMLHEWKKVISEWCTIIPRDSGNLNSSTLQSDKAFSVHTISEIIGLVQRISLNTLTEEDFHVFGRILSNRFTTIRELLKNIDVLIVNYDFLRQPLYPNKSSEEVPYKSEALSSYALRRSLLRGQFHYVICDEGHRIWNMSSLTSRRIFKLYSSFRLVLTGTPVQSNIAELVSLLKYITTVPHPSRDDMNKDTTTNHGTNKVEKFLKTLFNEIHIAQHATKLSRAGVNQVLEPLTRRLHQLLRPFMLRREREKVFPTAVRSKCPNLEDDATNAQPEVSLLHKPKLKYATHIIVKCPISDVQRSLLNKNFSVFESLRPRSPYLPAEVEPFSPLSAKSSHPKRVSMHPFLLLKDFAVDENIINSSGKLTVLDEIVHKLLSKHSEVFERAPFSPNNNLPKNKELNGPGKRTFGSGLQNSKIFDRKILIFSHFHGMLDILEEWARFRHIPSFRIDGTTPTDNRQKIIDRFNCDFSIPILFLSKKAGGLGLNLQVADTVIIYEVGSNYSLDEQVISRIRRINQTKRIKVVQLLCGAGLEDTSRGLSAQRKQTHEMVFDGDQMSHFATLQERALSLSSILQQGSSKAMGNAESSTIVCTSPSEGNWNAALSRFPEEEVRFREIDEYLEQSRFQNCIVRFQKELNPCPRQYLECGECQTGLTNKFPTYDESRMYEEQEQSTCVAATKKKMVIRLKRPKTE